MGRLTTASGSVSPLSTIAADAAPQDVSIARMRIESLQPFTAC
jgi:hypothetical protein